jgi:hypothetical protein
VKIDPKLLEAIVREVVERLLAREPDLPPGPGDDGRGVYEHYGKLLSESDLLLCRKNGLRAIRIDARTIITPLARDRARDLAIPILVRGER